MIRYVIFISKTNMSENEDIYSSSESSDEQASLTSSSDEDEDNTLVEQEEPQQVKVEDNNDNANDNANDNTNDVVSEDKGLVTDTEVFDSNASLSSTCKNRECQHGGRKISKKTKVDPLYLQRLIDRDLRAKIPISAFKQDIIVTMVKNTVGIICKVCGSDNVYVESKQVRSADEAMTKFYTCLNCGNKWRFD